jgi:hypothetical protein
MTGTMKQLTAAAILLVFTFTLSAQTEPCKVLLEKISGKYTGECINGLANGKGKSIGEDIYTGNFKDGLPDGKGKYVFRNGDIFQGFWSMGKKEGKGTLQYTLNGTKFTLEGFWKNDEYVGVKDPALSYRVISSTGLTDYKVERGVTAGELDKEVVISIKSAFTDFVPSDLKIEKSTGQIIQSARKFVITQYFCPLNIEISYSILLAGGGRKQFRFIVEILEEGKYAITLIND